MKKSVYKSLNLTAKAIRALEIAAQLNLENLREEYTNAQDEFDEKSDAWQTGEKGEEEYERLNNLESFINEIDHMIDNKVAAIEYLEQIENEAPEGSFD